jgi:hypothetical protein
VVAEDWRDADATRRESIARRKEPPRWLRKTGGTRTPPGASRTPDGRSHLGGCGRLAGRGRHPWWSFLVTPSGAWFDREAIASNSSSPAPRPASCPRNTGKALGPGPQTGETPNWNEGPSGPDRRPGRVSLRWAARGEQGTRTSWTCVTETRHRVRGGANRQGREKRRRRTEAGVEARDEVHGR